MRRWWLAGALALSAAFQAALGAFPPFWGHCLSIAGLIAVNVGAGGVFLYHSRGHGGSQRAWRVLGAAALGLWALALATDLVGLLAGASMAARMAVLAVVAQGALCCGTYNLLRVSGLRFDRPTMLRMGLDGLAVGLSLASLSWVALFGLKASIHAEAPGAVAVITLSASLLVTLSAALPIVLDSSQSGPSSLGSFAAGIAVMAAGGLLAAFATLAGNPAPERVAGGVLFFASLLIGRAATMPRAAFARGKSWPSRSTFAQAVPSLLLLALAVIAAVHQALVGEINPALTGMLFLLAVAVLTRQFLALTRNVRLAKELTQQRARLAYQAFHDPLTGLANRALFAERLESALAVGAPAVLVLDLDGFKAINDSRGHAVGDQLLVAAARRLRGAARGVDTVARMGGDEFAVLLPGPLDEIEVRYEPLVELAENRVVGAEAVPYWRHPTRGLLGPERFRDVAVRAGLAAALDRRVLDLACRTAARWPSRLTLSVDIALVDATLVDDVADLLLECGLAVDRLELDLGEAALANRAALADLAGLGLRLALAGHSSLNCLREPVLDTLKIAVDGFAAPGVNRADDAVLAATIGLLRTLGLRAVATGVESERRLAWLRARGCEYGQGGCFGPPVPAGEFLCAQLETVRIGG